jgi:DNA mismatch repair ATPase MutS
MSFVREDAAPDAAADAAVVPVINFLYKLAPGAADESFGLNVAKVRTRRSRQVVAAALNHQ